MQIHSAFIPVYRDMRKSIKNKCEMGKMLARRQCGRGGPSAADKDGEGEARRVHISAGVEGMPRWEWPRSRRLRQWDARGVISAHIVTLLAAIHRRKSWLCALYLTHTAAEESGTDDDEREEDERTSWKRLGESEREREIFCSCDTDARVDK